MSLYRVDRRHFEVGDIIEPQTGFESQMEGIKALEEQLINEYKPSHIPPRSQCLYLFCDLSSALLFSIKYKGHIYSVSPEKVYFRGDMNLLDCVHNTFQSTEDSQLRIASIKKYWEEGSHTFRPCYEVLVNKATVNAILFSNDDLLPSLKAELTSCCSIEQTQTFRDITISDENRK